MARQRDREPGPVVMIVQARMTSARLPGKVLMDLGGKPMLQRQLERLQRCRRVDRLVLATTDLPVDDPLQGLGEVVGVPVYRGPAEDVLGRYAGCARRYGAGVVVRVTGDCPLIDPALSDSVIAAFQQADPPLDYLSLAVDLVPRGLDTEVMTAAALFAAAAECTDPAHREHVTPFLYRNPTRFRTSSYRPIGAPIAARWCVDEAADLALVRRIVEALVPVNPDFGWRDCLEVMQRHPDWKDLNAGVRQRLLTD